MPKMPDKTEEALRLVGESMHKMSERIDSVEGARASDESLIELFKEFLELQKSRMLTEIRFNPDTKAEPLKVIDTLRFSLRRYDLSAIAFDPRARRNAASDAAKS